MTAECKTAHRCGFVAIVGRPNVGKSTLLNRLVGQKISITSRRPQTTRHRILGIKTTSHAQILYVDTPGLHSAASRAINRYMNRAAAGAIQEVNAIMLVVEALRWMPADEHVLGHCKRAGAPIVLAVNKVDAVADKARLLPYLAETSQRAEFARVVPVSARKGDNLAELEAQLIRYLPEGMPAFPEEQVTDRSERFMAAEIVREKLMRRLGKEVPYRLTVEVERFEERADLVLVDTIIWVERRGQKAIVVGREGKLLKAAGESARKDLEALLERKVFLRTWVKVKEGWSDDERALRRLGYRDA
ncbi:MAG: GTPase Era [Gammaproteobacteria bacterium]|nr:GTPase Era [Gammaproteobacteria bacterium]